MDLSIQKYDKDNLQIWDDFVKNRSCNGTIFHTQNFLSYHPRNRFNDHSIFIYDSNTIAAVILVAQIDENKYYSHPGTSGGGFVIGKNYYKAEKLYQIIEKAYGYFNNNLDSRIFESFFSEVNNDLIIFYIRDKGKLYSELSIYLNINNKDDLISTISDSKTRTAVRKLDKLGFNVNISTLDKDYKTLHQLVTNNLIKHNVKPIHSYQDILKIKKLLGDDQLLVLGKDNDGNIITAIWVIKANSITWHPQYIARDYETNLRCTVERTIIQIMELAREEGIKKLSLGISTEDNGEHLNFGLTSFKERMGGYHQFRYISVQN